MRSAPAYLNAAKFAKKQGDYLTARHYLLRAKAYGTFTGDALAKWEADNLYHVLADRIRTLLADAPHSTTLVFEAGDVADACIAAIEDAFPDMPRAISVSREDLLRRPDCAHEFLLANDYVTLTQRNDFAPRRMRSLTDLVETCRVTSVR